MRNISFFLLLFLISVSGAVSASVTDRLHDLQEGMFLRPGYGIGRSVIQVFEEKNGNPMELALALEASMENWETRNCAGYIDLSTGQKDAWIPVTLEDWMRLFGCDDDAVHCPFAWLGVKLPVVPSPVSIQKTSAAYAWIDVFPGLCGTETLNKRYFDCIKESDMLNVVHKAALQRTFSADAVVEALITSFSERFSLDDMFTKEPAVFPGYGNSGGLTMNPVKVRERNIGRYPDAVLHFELCGEDGTVFLSCCMNQKNVAGQDIKLSWYEGNIPELFIGGTVVCRGVETGVVPIVFRVSRLVSGNVTDVVECDLFTGTELAPAISSGTSVQYETEDIVCRKSKKTRELQDAAAKLTAAAFGVLDKRQIFMTAGAMPVRYLTPAFVPRKGAGEVSLQGLESVEAAVSKALWNHFMDMKGDLKGLLPVLRLCAMMYSSEYSEMVWMDDIVFQLIDSAVGQLAKGPVIMEFSVSSEWISSGSVECKVNVCNSDGWIVDVFDQNNVKVDTIFSENEDDVFLYRPDHDGIYALRLTAEGIPCKSVVVRKVVFDSSPPELECIVKQEGDVLNVHANAADDNPDIIRIEVFSADGTPVFFGEYDENEISSCVAVEEAGLYDVFVTASDRCGNVSEYAHKISVDNVSESAGGGNVTVAVKRLNPARRLVSGPFEVIAKADGMEDVKRIEMYLDGELVSSAENVSVLEVLCNTDGWQSMKHTIAAVAFDGSGNGIFSRPAVFYYTTFCEDGLAPVIEVFPNGKGSGGVNEFVIKAMDESGVSSIAVFADSEKVGEKFFPEGSETGILELFVPKGTDKLHIIAEDVSGNVSEREVQFSGTGITGLEISSSAFGIEEFSGDAIVAAVVAGHAESVALYLNGIEYGRKYYPEDGIALFRIAEEDMADGRNAVECTAFSLSGDRSASDSGIIAIPVIMEADVSPEKVCPFMGTPGKFNVTGKLRSRQRWIVSIAGTDLQCSGYGNEISVEFDAEGLEDGDYQLIVSVPETASEKLFDVTVDAVIGKPAACIDHPVEGGIVREGVLRVTGCAALEDNEGENEEVEYAFVLRDADGRILELKDLQFETEWRLRAGYPLMGIQAGASRWHRGNIPCGDLALIDLSGLKDGCYELELNVRHKGQVVKYAAGFYLKSNLKSGEFAFEENDMTVNAGGLSIKSGRRYSAFAAGTDTGLGYGWSHTLLIPSPYMDETRSEMECEDGSMLSARVGGTRDIVATLSDGRRTRFVFSLVEGGSMSFCCYARWTAIGSGATLVPDCSDKLMVLPGMEPYWEASGPETPWDMFDFPSFTLTDIDGTVYHIAREKLGDGNLLMGGEYAYIEAYGDLGVESVRLPDGKIVYFSKKGICSKDSSGAVIEAVAFEYEDGRLVSASGNGMPAVDVFYEYDGKGNLSGVRRSVNGGDIKCYRTFEYGLTEFPHHITAVRDGNGGLLASVEYDEHGRMVRCSGRDGGSVSSESDVFSGSDVIIDQLGRETFLEYDMYGNVTSRTLPDGAVTKYEYDSFGNEVYSCNAAGEEVFRRYDGSGRLLQRVMPDGRTVDYEYNGNYCSRIVDSVGGATEFRCDSRGNPVSVIMSGGGEISLKYDDEGRMIERSFNGRNRAVMQYDGGRLSAVTYDSGIRYEYSYGDLGLMTRKRMILFHPVTDEEIVSESVWEYDENGRCIFMQDSDGNWSNMKYDVNGRCAEYEDSRGKRIAMKYDSGGRVVETVLDGMLVARSGYDKAGQCVFTTEYTEASAYSEKMQFSRVHRRTYDAVGRPLSSEYLSGAEVSLKAMGNDIYRTELSGGSIASISVSEHDSGGRLRRLISPDGGISSLKYDSGGRITSITDSYGRCNSFLYDSSGRVSSVENAAGGKGYFDYDSIGNCVGIMLPDGGMRRQLYDGDGNVTGRMSPDGDTVMYSRDQYGQIISVDMPDAGEGRKTFFYNYDSLGGLCSVVDPSGNETVFENDQHGRRELMRLPDGSECRNIYEDGGVHPRVFIDFAGNRIVSEYDNSGGLLSRKIFPHGSDRNAVSYTYRRNAFGLLEAIEMEAGEKTEVCRYEYDVEGRLVFEETDGNTIKYSYDACSRLSAVEVNGVETVFSHGTGEDVTEMTLKCWKGSDCREKYIVRRDAFSLPSELVRPDGSVRYTVRNNGGCVVSIREVDGAGNEICRFEYEYDTSSRMTACNEIWKDGFERRRRWRYDSWSRLVSEISVSNESSADYSLELEYDSNGNVLRRRREGMDGVYTAEYEYDNCDRMRCVDISRGDGFAERHEILWNACGQLEKIVNGGNIMCSFLWNEEGRLLRVEKEDVRIEYDYDSRGMLCGRKVLEKNGSGLQEASDMKILYGSSIDGTVPQLLVLGDEYVLDANEAIALRSDSGTVNVYADAAGTVTGCNNMDGIKHFMYDARGVPLVFAEGSSAGLGFNGEFQDFSAGLVYLRSRFYMPELGVFISPDIAPASAENPQTINRYAYCCGDPVNRIDPMGTMSISLVMTWSSIAACTGLMYVNHIARTYATYFRAQDANNLINMEKEHRNATVIVHGVAPHENGYADDMVSFLERLTDSQDYHQMLWSGFAIKLLHFPNRFEHYYALETLLTDIFTLYHRGYENINIIAHSWGTVISKDYNIRYSMRAVPIGLWVTMGSPLPNPEYWVPLPEYPGVVYNNLKRWYNFYSLTDPVVYFMMDSWDNVRPKDASLYPLFKSGLPQQFRVTSWYCGSPHSIYWTNPDVLMNVSKYLNSQ